MTTHTPAQHEAAIQEGERIAAADEYFKARTWIMDTNDNRRIFEAGFDRAYALLSKLRAPVADERSTPPMPKPAILWHSDFTNQTYYGYTADHMREYARAALASAPVAGEAQPVAEVVSRYGDPEAFGERDLKVLVDLNSYPYGTKFYAAPQASEVVVMRFALEAIEAEMNPEWECNSYHPKLRMAAERLRDALSAQPGAQKTGGSDE